MDSSETGLCYEDMGMFKRETPRLKTNTGLFHWRRHMTSSSWYQSRNDPKWMDDMNWCRRDERRQSNRSQIQHMANFPEEGHFAFEQSSAFDFPPQFPQLDLPQQQGAGQDCDFHPAGYFLPLLFSVYLLCESSDGGKWLRTVIETVPFVHKKDSMCHVLCFWLVFGCICI